VLSLLLFFSSWSLHHDPTTLLGDHPTASPPMHPHHVRLPSLRTLDIAIFLDSPSPPRARHSRPEIAYSAARPASTTPPNSPEYASDECTKDRRPRKLSRRACAPCQVSRLGCSRTRRRPLTASLCAMQKHHTSCGNVRPCLRCVSRGSEEDCIDVPVSRSFPPSESSAGLTLSPLCSSSTPPDQAGTQSSQACLGASSASLPQP
jgi:hypothetical protein